jgi:hypothetical protein
MFITDSVLPYLHSTQRQLGKQSTTSNGGNAELALKHLAWLMDIGSTMCWLVSSLPAATISQLTGTPGGECDAAVDDPALSVAGQLIISLQEAYDELVPILINYLSSAVAQQTNDRYSLLARLHLLGLFRCLLDKCYECPLLLSSCGDIQLLQSDDSINMKATGLFHEYSRIWMLLIERHPIADGERRLAIDAPLLIDLVHFYGDDRGELQPLHSIINRFADSADTTSLEFAHASIQQLVREPISGDWLINLRPPSSLDSQRSWSTQTLTTTDQQTRIASQIDTPAVDLQLDSLITAVRDIFPDLKEEFVQTILLHHDRDLERTIAALCDQSSSTEQSSRAGHSILQPQLQQQQQQGRAATAVVDYATQKVLDDRNDWGNIAAFKANTLQASGDYAAQIEFDDERDDADELGDNDLFDPWMRSTTVTNSSTDASAAAVVARNKSLLLRAYTRDPLLFERKQRGSRARQQLRQETRFSDEQIEGWRIMLERNVSYHRHSLSNLTTIICALYSHLNRIY